MLDLRISLAGGRAKPNPILLPLDQVSHFLRTNERSMAWPAWRPNGAVSLMSRTPARCTEADIARSIRAARQAGAGAVELLPDGTIRISLIATTNKTDTRLEPEEEVAPPPPRPRPPHLHPRNKPPRHDGLVCPPR